MRVTRPMLAAVTGMGDTGVCHQCVPDLWKLAVTHNWGWGWLVVGRIWVMDSLLLWAFSI